MTRSAIRWALVIVLVVLCGASFACFTPRYNEAAPPAGTVSAAAAPSAGPGPVQDEDTLFLVAFSGGGTRAAAMSWAVLDELRNIPYHYVGPDGRVVHSTLADEIDYVSGISGGSFAAAAWCLFRDDPAAMAAFREDFLERDIQGALLVNLLWPPWRGMELLSPYYDRIHVAAELYDREVFGEKTFGDLPAHPKLWINATNLSLGDRFTFKLRDEADDESTDFDLIGSDLARYPIGYACAASSAFPVLLSPMTLINRGPHVDLDTDDAEFHYQDKKLDARESLDIEADYYVRKRDFYNDKRNRYIHLADGGLVDNQGLQAILDQFSTDGVVFRRINNSPPPLKRLIVLNVNAGVAGEDDSSHDQSAPGVTSVISYTTVLSMDVLSMKRWVQISSSIDELRKVADELGDQASLAELERTPPFAIEINFRNIKDDERRAAAWKLPTSFALDAAQLGLIESEVAELVRDNPELQRLERSLNASCVEAGCTHPLLSVPPGVDDR